MAEQNKTSETESNDVVDGKVLVTVVNKGLSLIVYGGERHKPDTEFQVERADLEKPSFQYLIGSDQLEVKNDSEATQEIKKKVNSRKKKDPDERKTIKEMEDGGEF